MKNIIKLEEASMFLLGVLMFFQLPIAWWWFLVLILAPDIGMLGYLINPKVGSVTYNLLHHKAVGIGLIAIGGGWGSIALAAAGVIIFTHSSVDRIFGFGLKFNDSFNNTHLGKIGK